MLIPKPGLPMCSPASPITRSPIWRRCWRGTGPLKWNIVSWRHECRQHCLPQDHARRRQARGPAPHRGAADIAARSSASCDPGREGWTNSHLYEIRAGDVGWGMTDPDWGDGPLGARKARLIEVLEDAGTKTLRYLYDFGDGWEHTIKVERLLDPDHGVVYPRL